MMSHWRLPLAVLLVASLAGARAGAETPPEATGKFPGMALGEGQTLADIGSGERISQPSAAALAALQPDARLAIEVGDWVVFRPKQDDIRAGMIFYHGAETDPRVYGRPLRAIAEQGYLVVAVTLPRYLAVMAPDKADEVIAEYPEVTDWVVAGHSMGGAMAAQYALSHATRVKGVLLWDAYPPDHVDLTAAGFSVGQIYRTDASGTAPENFRAVAHLLPEDAMRVPIAGAAHTYFGDYILAPHRPAPVATISLDDQQEIIVAASLQFMEISTAEAAHYSIRCDERSDLCWQDPQRKAYDQSDYGLTAAEAGRYCAELVLGGYADWRLPDINELRGLIAGNPATETGGQCKLTIGQERSETLSGACWGRQLYAGPGANGCYIKDSLTGTCNKPGPPTATQNLEVWAANQPSDTDGWQAYVSFDSGSMGYNHINSAGDVRCVRQGLVAEQAGLLPTNLFVPAQVQIADACDVSDKLELKITVPEVLSQDPAQLMVFFYADDKWRFPPASPPDGGTSDNVIANPQFEADNSIAVTLPACTYYRERGLRGDYRVYVQLLMEKRRPPVIGTGDYFWGSNNELVSVPFDGNEHRGSVRPMEISLWPVTD
jgi:pimeloyl-ACP methyl ester carboxylesterase